MSQDMIRPCEIKEIRRQLGLTQEGLAKHLGLTRDAIAAWEIGRSKPRPPAEKLLRLMAAGLPTTVHAS